MSSAVDDRELLPVAVRPTKRVLVSFESSARGRVALREALGLAQQRAAVLSVVCVATKEPVNVGCARCRQSAALWNREIRAVAEEELVEAARLIGTTAEVDYEVAVGGPVDALARVAARTGCDLVVLPSEPTRGLRRLLSRTIADKLRLAGGWEVIVAPAPQRRRSLTPPQPGDPPTA